MRRWVLAVLISLLTACSGATTVPTYIPTSTTFHLDVAPATSAPELALSIDWNRIDNEDVFSGGVAVGSSGTHISRPTVSISTDGSQWDVVFDDVSADRIGGAIDTGPEDSEASIVMSSVTATPDGFVAIGSTGTPNRGLIWRSSDGFFWTLVAEVVDSERRTLSVFPEAVISTTAGLVAVGSTPVPGSFPPISVAVVWVSGDGGTTWQQVERTSTSLASVGPGAPWHVGGMTDVITSGQGVLAVGYVPLSDGSLPGRFYRQAVWLGSWTG